MIVHRDENAEGERVHLEVRSVRVDRVRADSAQSVGLMGFEFRARRANDSDPKLPARVLLELGKGAEQPRVRKGFVCGRPAGPVIPGGPYVR